MMRGPSPQPWGPLALPPDAALLLFASPARIPQYSFCLPSPAPGGSLMPTQPCLGWLTDRPAGRWGFRGAEGLGLG